MKGAKNEENETSGDFKVNHADMMKFVQWLTSPEKGQKIIADFGKDKYGAPLFFANSKEWREKQGLKK